MRFGQGNDLQIFHNGADSYISQQGTGNLTIANITDDQDVRIQSDDGSGSTADYFRADGSTGEAILYHYGTQKLATKSTGIDVTGTLTATGFVGNVTGIASTATTVQATENTTNTFYRIPFLSADTGNVSLYSDNGIKYNPSTNELVATTRNVNVVANNSNDETVYLTFVDAPTAGQEIETDTALTYNPSKNQLTVGIVTGATYYGDGSNLTGISGGGGISNVVEDTTPQLGGTLETNGNLIQFGDSSSSTDDRLRFGAGNDLQIWHNGANSYISQSSNVGDLYLTSLNDDNDVIIQTDSGDGNTVDYFRADGSTGEAKLFHYGSEKIKTINTGVSVTGIITASGDIQTDGAFRAESSNSTERFEIAYNETTDSLDFSYFAS